MQTEGVELLRVIALCEASEQGIMTLSSADKAQICETLDHTPKP
jgi:hypothetical protein